MVSEEKKEEQIPELRPKIHPHYSPLLPHSLSPKSKPPFVQPAPSAASSPPPGAKEVQEAKGPGNESGDPGPAGADFLEQGLRRLPSPGEGLPQQPPVSCLCASEHKHAVPSTRSPFLTLHAPLPRPTGKPPPEFCTCLQGLCPHGAVRSWGCELLSTQCPRGWEQTVAQGKEKEGGSP